MVSRDNSFSLLSVNRARGLAACFLSADVALVVLYLFLFLHGNPIGHDKPGMFNMDGEGNIPSWYSATKLFAVALCTYLYGRPVLSKDKVAGLLILLGGALFAYLSMDEGAELHEKIGDRFNMLVSGGSLTDRPIFETTGLWMLFLGPPLFLALVGGVVYLRKRLSIPSDVFAKALTSIVIFVSAAAPGDILVNYVSGDAHIIQTAAEEFCEMVGVTLILWAAMTLLARQQPIVAEAPMPRAPERRPARQELPAAGRGDGGLPIPVPVQAQRQPS